MKEITTDIIKSFNDYLISEEKSQATIEKYLRDARAFADFSQGCEITKETSISFKQKLIDSGFAVRSVNSMIASLNSLFSFLGWNDLRVKNIRLQQEIFRPEEKELSKNEYERLCKTALKRHNERLCLILQTICGTGIRVSELQFITVEAVRNGEARVS